jgi:hypothetical protein
MDAVAASVISIADMQDAVRLSLHNIHLISKTLLAFRRAFQRALTFHVGSP